MIWSKKKPVPADMIRVQLGAIYHFGIYISDSEIIQFGLPPTSMFDFTGKDIKVLATDINVFSRGNQVEVAEFSFKEKLQKKSKKEIIKFAQESIGMEGYNILHNNCEHFAYKCVFGKEICTQTNSLRDKWLNKPRLDVYISKIPDQFEFGLKNREKHWAMHTLEYAGLRSFGAKKENINEKCKYSVSCLKDKVAVAVSNQNVKIKLLSDETVKIKSKIKDSVKYYEYKLEE